MAQTTRTMESILADFDDAPQLQTLVEDLFNHRVNPEVTASSIAAAAKAKHGSDEMAGYVDNVRSIIIACATDVASMHSVLTKLVLELSALPAKEVEELIFASFWSELGDVLSSVWHDSAELERYVNLNSFEAQLWQLSDGRVSEFMIDDGMKNFSQGLENGQNCLQGLDGEITAAAMWAIHGKLVAPFHISDLLLTIFHKGSRLLRQKCVQGEPASSEWRGTLWQGEAGYSDARWSLWKERFREAADAKIEDLQNGTRRLAGYAALAMERAETGASNPEL